jgi:hypothetical protein
MTLTAPIIDTDPPEAANMAEAEPIDDTPALDPDLQAALARLDGLPEAWIVDFRPAYLDAARAIAASRDVHARLTAAQAVHDQALAALDLDAVSAAALDLQRWSLVAAALDARPGPGREAQAAALGMATTAMTNAAATVRLREPRYHAERSTWQALPNHVRADPNVEPPVPTPGTIGLSQHWDPLVSACVDWRSSYDVVLAQASSGGPVDVVGLMHTAAELVGKAEDLADRAAAFEDLRRDADGERAGMGLTWYPPAGMAPVTAPTIDLLGRARD